MDFRKLLLAGTALSTLGWAQSDGAFQVNYAVIPQVSIILCDSINCDEGIDAAKTTQGEKSTGGKAIQAGLPVAFPFLDPVVNFTNTGASSANDICVNTYTFAPDEQLISCCACRVTRNALWSLRVQRDLLSNTLTPAIENSVVIKLLSTAAPAAGNCDPANPGPNAPGLAAWGTTFHLQTGNSGVPFMAESPFTNSTLSNAERNVMTSYCAFIHANGSGYGVCRACQRGLLGLGPDDTYHNRGLGGEKQ